MTADALAAALRECWPEPNDDDEYHPGWCPWCGEPENVCNGDCDPEDEDE